MPGSRRYYARLVGAYDGSTSLRGYASGEGTKFIENLLAWRPLDGFLFSLLLSSHAALTAEISVVLPENEEVVRAYSFLEGLGDRISQLGAIEVGLRVLPEVPEIEPFLVGLIEQIRDENVDETNSRFKLLSTLFWLVDGELSRTRLFSEHPPFYRRLASLSQSALICRQLVNLGVEIESFCDWVVDQQIVNHVYCYLQSLVDTRLEPRWIPEFATASLMRGEFVCRIMDTALDCNEALKNVKLYDLILGPDTDSIWSHTRFTHAQIVGPLEGQEAAPDSSSTTVLNGKHINLTVKFNLTSHALRELVQNDSAEYVALITCSRTFSRETYRVDQDDEAVVFLESGDYDEELELTPYVVAMQKIDGFLASEHAEEFRVHRPNGFDIPAAAILAVGDSSRITLEDGGSVESIIDLARNDRVEEGTFVTDLGDNRITIYVPKKDKEKIETLRRQGISSTEMAALFPAIYLHAIIEALQNLAVSDHADKQWTHSIRRALERASINVDDDELKSNALKYAQKLMRQPVGRFLTAFTNPDSEKEF